MRKLFIHIGTHKTGTTSVQWYLNRHQSILRAYGTYVPRAGCPSESSSGHHNIAWTLLRDRRASSSHGCIEALLRELERSRLTRAVVSSEEFEFLAARPDDLAQLDARIRRANWQPVYVLFLRSPGAYAISLLHEFPKQSLKVDVGDFFSRTLEEGCYTPPDALTLHVDFDALVAKWRAAAQGELRICSYDDAAKNGGLMPALMAALELPGHLGALRQRRMNVSRFPVTDEMREGARRLDEKFRPGFLRHTAAAAMAGNAAATLAAAAGLAGSAPILAH